MSNEEQETPELSEEEHLRNYFKAMVAIDNAMEPLKEHMKALKANYVENHWLSRDKMSMILKAYRAHKSELDLEELGEMMDLIKREINRS
jgi:hypothetical protein